MNFARTTTLLLLASLAWSAAIPVRGDDDDDDDHERGKKGSQRREQPANKAAPTAPPAYKDECAACHMAYPAGLLPAASWEKLMSGLPKHFGEDVEIAAASRTAIQSHLTGNAADKSASERSRKIMKNVGGTTPERISEIPYIRAKHREIKDEVFKRKSVETRGNCSACHSGAERGDFDDDRVRIPK